ncbi:MAG TPA: hypothetical protein VMV44_02785 [Rectinemataceae bacterium]|nr:hypothetical protein [Rectinemataceae bacterium]
MLFRDRTDGKRLRLPAFNAILPFLMKGRNSSAVYFGKDIEVENAIRYVHRKNAESGANAFSLFGLLLAAGARTFFEKPDLNRFIKGRTFYARHETAFSFVVKKRLTEEAGESIAKVRFEAGDTVYKMMDRINEAIDFAKSEIKGAGDREIDLAHRLPFGKSIITSGFRFLDALNIAPASMLKADPLYTSAFFANLGSIGLDAPFHHLYEWGTASLFVVVGRTFQKEVRLGDGSTVRRTHIGIRATVDERISEGIYFAHAASLFQRYILRPELMELAPSSPNPGP